MPTKNLELTRRRFVKILIAAAGAISLPLNDRAAAIGAETSVPAATSDTGKAKYTRFNVMSDGGRKALASYAKGVEAMLKLPSDSPQNWFRNAFIHLMDCPHGNWWFYVWHRAYLGYFEQTIRKLSGDDTFALPYWDWTTLPQIPDSMFDGVLTPQSSAFEPYTGNLALFTSHCQPALKSYWAGLDSAQRAQLNIRGYTDFDKMWNDVTGYAPPPQDFGVSGNMAFVITCGSRYLSRDNPKLDQKTAYNVSPFIVYSGLLPTDFHNPEATLSFTSAKTPSHHSPPGAFSTLEGLSHNKVHNCIGGVGPLDPGPYGNMTNFLSPVDPVFFLHHANIDRLWDLWTRKQQSLGLPYLPSGQDLKDLSDDVFAFFVDAKGNYVGSIKAGEYFATEKFEYSYEPGFGEKVVHTPNTAPTGLSVTPRIEATVRGNVASLSIPATAIKKHLAAPLGTSLIADVRLPWPSATSIAREFDVLVGAPPAVQTINVGSPYYAGTIAFFGNMMRMRESAANASFAVPLPKAPGAFHGLGVAKSLSVNVRLVPSHPHGEVAPTLKSLSVRML